MLREKRARPGPQASSSLVPRRLLPPRTLLLAPVLSPTPSGHQPGLPMPSDPALLHYSLPSVRSQPLAFLPELLMVGSGPCNPLPLPLRLEPCCTSALPVPPAPHPRAQPAYPTLAPRKRGTATGAARRLRGWRGGVGYQGTHGIVGASSEGC